MMETKIPHTKQETFDQLDKMLSEKDKSELANGDAIEFHFSLGLVDSKQLDLSAE